jgi:hypothetical protein
MNRTRTDDSSLALWNYQYHNIILLYTRAFPTDKIKNRKSLIITTLLTLHTSHHGRARRLHGGEDCTVKSVRLNENEKRLYYRNLPTIGTIFPRSRPKASQSNPHNNYKPSCLARNPKALLFLRVSNGSLRSRLWRSLPSSCLVRRILKCSWTSRHKSPTNQ